MKKFLFTILIFLLALTCLFSIDLTSKITKVSMHPDFWGGLFPTSVSYMFQIGGFEFIPQRTTEAGVTLSTGTLARTITRNPLTGEALPNHLSDIGLSSIDYDTVFAAWKIGLAQGFGYSEASKKDLITLSFSVDGQWEIALDPILQSAKRTGHPFQSPIFTANTEKTLIGAPDLSGDRQLMSMSFNIGANLNMLLLKTAKASGIKTEFKATWAPNFLTSKKYNGKADFWKLWLFAESGLMLHQATDEHGLNLWSFGLTDELEIRVLGGQHIPKYAETLKGSIWWYEPESLTFLARNTLRLNYYGQQFFGSCVPLAYVFLDMSYAGGKVNNLISYKKDSIWTGSFGFHIELQMFEFIHLYYELGKIFLFTGNNPAFSEGYRSSETIKFQISLNL